MRQTRLSLGCRDWQHAIHEIGAAAAGLLLYLRLLMRSMESAEIIASIAEIAEACGIGEDIAAQAITRIADAGMLDISHESDGLIVCRSKAEAAALAERRRKAASRIAGGLRKAAKFLAPGTSEKTSECPEYTLFDNTGNSGEDKSSTNTARSASRVGNNKKEYKTESPTPVYTRNDRSGMSVYTLFDQINMDSKNKKIPRTPEKIKSLTESTGHAHASAPVRESELPVDQLEADYIDVCGLMPQSLRDAIRQEPADVREAFYLYVRQRRDEEGSRWAGDRIRIAWLAARRIPAERRAESILAAAMGSWKTIRDAGSGCYFERSTGRVVSLVRGVIDRDKQPQTGQTETALRLARNMRRA